MVGQGSVQGPAMSERVIEAPGTTALDSGVTLGILNALNSKLHSIKNLGVSTFFSINK